MTDHNTNTEKADCLSSPAQVWKLENGGKQIDFRKGKTRHKMHHGSRFGFCPKCGEHGIVTVFPNGDVVVIHVANYYPNGTTSIRSSCIIKPEQPNAKKKPKRKRKGK